jgi:hypothetical protein
MDWNIVSLTIIKLTLEKELTIMIISSTERKWTIAVAVLMLLAAVSYLIIIDVQVLPNAATSWDQLSFGELLLLLTPVLMLTVYGICLLCFYRNRGVRVSIAHGGESLYTGSKYPDWL